MQVLVKTAADQQKVAIDRNTKYYSGLTQQFLPGDLVFAFTERNGDPNPHCKFKLKWAGPFIFIARVNTAMVDIGTMQSCQHPARWKREVFTIHRSKLRLYQKRAIWPQDERVEMTDRFSDVETVRREHVEPRQVERASYADMLGVPTPWGGRSQTLTPPLTP